MSSEYEDFFNDMWADTEQFYITLTRSGSTTSLIPALVVKTSLALVDEFATQMLSKVKDITVKTSDLILDDESIFPTRGDTITLDDGTTTYTYEIFADVAPTYCDPLHDLIKMHVHEISNSPSDGVLYNEYGEPVYTDEGSETFPEGS